MNCVLVVENDRREKDTEDVIAVPLQGRARLVLVLRLFEQEVEGAFFELARSSRAQFFGSWVEQVDPVHGHCREIRAAAG